MASGAPTDQVSWTKLSWSDKFWYSFGGVVMGAAGYCFGVGVQVAMHVRPQLLISSVVAVVFGYGFLRLLFYRLSVGPPKNQLKAMVCFRLCMIAFMPMFMAGLAYITDGRVDWVLISIIAGVIAAFNGMELIVRWCLRPGAS